MMIAWPEFFLQNLLHFHWNNGQEIASAERAQMVSFVCDACQETVKKPMVRYQWLDACVIAYGS
jgi:hypothetical protein